MDVETGLLRALVAVSEERHFGRSAARLGITQQALSKRVKRLEEQVGVTLVDRGDRRQVRLTAEGQRVIIIGRQVLALLDRLAPVREQGRLRVDVLGEGLAPSTWLRRATAGTSLPLDAVHRPPHTTAEHLVRTGGADIAFGRAGAVPTPWPDGLTHRLVRYEPVALLIPQGHRWAQLAELPLAALRGEALWFPMAAAPVEWRSYVADLQEVAGFELDMTGSTFGFRQWARDVTAGSAAPSLVGEAMVLPDPGMRTVPLVDPTPVFPWSVVSAGSVAEAVVQEVLHAMGLMRAPGLADDVWLPCEEIRFAAVGAGARR